MAKLSSLDCRKFIVSQVPSQIMPATSWAYDEDSAWNELLNNMMDQLDAFEPDENDPEVKAKVLEIQKNLETKVLAVLSEEKNWKRLYKIKGTGSVAIIRAFNCDTKEGMFDGQVAYEVLEHLDGTLTLGQYVGD